MSLGTAGFAGIVRKLLNNVNIQTIPEALPVRILQMQPAPYSSYGAGTMCVQSRIGGISVPLSWSDLFRRISKRTADQKDGAVALQHWGIRADLAADGKGFRCRGIFHIPRICITTILSGTGTYPVDETSLGNYGIPRGVAATMRGRSGHCYQTGTLLK